MSKELLEPLVHLLVSLDVEVQKASSHALSNFALHGPGKAWGAKQDKEEDMQRVIIKKTMLE